MTPEPADISEILVTTDDPVVARVVRRVVEEVQPLRVILFGSRAKGMAWPDSDVDLLVVLHGEVRPYDEIKRTSAFGLDLMIEHDLELSIQPYSIDDYSSGQRIFLCNVRQDGIEV